MDKKSLAKATTLSMILCCRAYTQASPAAPTDGAFPIVASAPIASIVGEPPGAWNWGGLLTVEHARSAAPVFRTYDRSGASTSVTLRIDTASRVNVYSGRFGRGRDGSVAAGGSAYSSELQGASFLALISSDGVRQTIVRTSPFAIYALTVAADGVVWTAGMDIENGREVNPNHPVIRRFDSKGSLLSSLAPKDSVPLRRTYLHPAQYSQLVSGADRVGWYSEATGLYMEFSLEGRLIGQIEAPTAPKDVVVAACEDGAVYLSGIFEQGTEKSWGIYRLDRGPRSWRLFPRSEKWGMLFGCDGGRLVATTNGMNSLLWLDHGREKTAGPQ